MVWYLVAVLAGGLIGFLLKAGILLKTRQVFFNISLIGLLFFMGAGLGKDPKLVSKLATFGLNAFVISLSAVIFSVLAVFILVRTLGRGQR